MGTCVKWIPPFSNYKKPEEPRMPILHSLLAELKAEFSDSEKGKERSVWFLHTLRAIILPFTSSKTIVDPKSWTVV